MKRVVIAAFAAVIVMAQGTAAADEPAIAGHRGVPYLAPENSLAGLTLAAQSNLDWIEVDVRYTKDGVPVLIHDGSIQRTTTGTGEVAALTFTELRAFTVEGPNLAVYRPGKVPTLWEALSRVAQTDPDAGVLIELKTLAPNADALRRTVSAVISSKMYGRAVFISDTQARLDEARALAASAYGWRAPTGLLYVGQKLPSEIKATWALPYKSSVTPEYVASLHAAGLRVGSHVANSRTDWLALVAAGVDLIITDRPIELQGYLP